MNQRSFMTISGLHSLLEKALPIFLGPYCIKPRILAFQDLKGDRKHRLVHQSQICLIDLHYFARQIKIGDEIHLKTNELG